MNLSYCDPVVGIIRPIEPGDFGAIGLNMTQQDAEEMWSYERLNPMAAIWKSFNKSKIAMTIEHDGIPVAMFGIITMDGSPTLWMLKTDGLKAIGRNFVRNTREWINKMLEEYPALTCYVDCRNKASERWIKFVGGKEVDMVFMGFDDMPFRKFVFRKNHE